jgi:hypothetical protein
VAFLEFDLGLVDFGIDAAGVVFGELDGAGGWREAGELFGAVGLVIGDAGGGEEAAAFGEAAAEEGFVGAVEDAGHEGAVVEDGVAAAVEQFREDDVADEALALGESRQAEDAGEGAAGDVFAELGTGFPGVAVFPGAELAAEAGVGLFGGGEGGADVEGVDRRLVLDQFFDGSFVEAAAGGDLKFPEAGFFELGPAEARKLEQVAGIEADPEGALAGFLEADEDRQGGPQALGGVVGVEDEFEPFRVGLGGASKASSSVGWARTQLCDIGRRRARP